MVENVICTLKATLLQTFRWLHALHELPGIVAQPGCDLLQMFRIGSAFPGAIFHSLAEEFGPVSYLAGSTR